MTIDRVAISIQRVRDILADDKNYQTDSLKLGGIWNMCEWAAKYRRGTSSEGAFVEVLPHESRDEPGCDPDKQTLDRERAAPAGPRDGLSLGLIDLVRRAASMLEYSHSGYIAGSNGDRKFETERKALVQECSVAISGEECDVPTDGQILDQLEAAVEKLDTGYCEQDVPLRKLLATALVRFNRAALNR